MNKEILEDITRDCYCRRPENCQEEGDKWCFIMDVITSMGLSDRQAEQLRLVYDYKYMTSKKEGYDIGKERALREFVGLYAEKFAHAYKDGMKRDELFHLVFGVLPMPTDEEIRTHIKG